MNKFYIALGTLAVLLSISGIRAELSVEPLEQEACCSIIQYDVEISNPHNGQRSYTLSVEGPPGLRASLEPSLVLVPAKSTETLKMVVDVPCTFPKGEYLLTVNLDANVPCHDQCNVLCREPLDSVQVSVDVPECIQAIPEPEPVVEPEPQNDTVEEEADTPTAAAISGGLIDAGILVLLVAIIALILFIVKKGVSK
jgi:hypothetical protein